MKPRILHLSADYPDAINTAKTRAIAGLIEGTAAQFDHLVVSLNRRGGLGAIFHPGALLRCLSSDNVLAAEYAALPAAVVIAPVMRSLAERIAHAIEPTGFRPDVIQAHKLTIEGVLAHELAGILGVPYLLTLQGNTDQKLLRQRGDRLPLMRRVWRDAAAIMAFAPWTATWCANRLGQRGDEVSIIPCILPHDALLAPEITPPLIRTAFHLNHWRNKNVATLLRAAAHVKHRFPDMRLEIAGDGSPVAGKAIARRIAHAGLQDSARLIGPVPSAEIQRWFNGAAVFVLPSRRESFGMVFAEALLAGTPVIYPSDAAIDGLLGDQPFACAVPAMAADRLALAVGQMLDQQAKIKAALAGAQQAGALNMLRRSEVLRAYARFLRSAVAPR